MPNTAMAGRTARAAAGALLTACTLLAAAGCGDSEDGSGSSRSERGPGSSSKAGSGGSSPAASGSAKPSPEPEPTPTAADGTDTAACSDGNCEIAVSEPVTISLDVFQGPAKLALTKVGKNEIAYEVTLGTKNNGSHTSAEASGPDSACSVTIHQGGSSGSCGPAGDPPAKQKDAVVMHLRSGPDGTAILRLTAG